MVIWPTRQDGLINRTVRQESGWCEFLLFGWMAAKLVGALAILLADTPRIIKDGSNYDLLQLSAEAEAPKHICNFVLPIF